MNTTIRREGANLILELTAEGSDGNGITSGITVTGTVHRRGVSDLYWNSGTNAFDLGS